MKNVFNKLISRLHTAGERIDELDKSIETSQTVMQRLKLKNKNIKECGMISKGVADTYFEGQKQKKNHRQETFE